MGMGYSQRKCSFYWEHAAEKKQSAFHLIGSRNFLGINTFECMRHEFFDRFK
jgi:hypothetical protein